MPQKQYIITVDSQRRMWILTDDVENEASVSDLLSGQGDVLRIDGVHICKFKC